MELNTDPFTRAGSGHEPFPILSFGNDRTAFLGHDGKRVYEVEGRLVGNAGEDRVGGPPQEEHRDVEVLLVGKGRDEEALRNLADRLGVPTRFEVEEFLDQVDELGSDLDRVEARLRRLDDRGATR
mgnify:CR=1 FL=1